MQDLQNQSRELWSSQSKLANQSKHQYIAKPSDGSAPASSCAAVSSTFSSSYYWVRVSNGSAVHVYWDMTRSCSGVTGGWMRVAHLDMTNNSYQCPRGLCEKTSPASSQPLHLAAPLLTIDTLGIP